MTRRPQFPTPLRWLPALLWIGLIFLLSAQPGSSFPKEPLAELPIPLPLDALAHLGLYGVLGLLVGVAAAPGRGWEWVWTFLACTAYSFSDELHQILVPGRAFQVADLLLDGGGSLAGLALAHLTLRRSLGDL